MSKTAFCPEAGRATSYVFAGAWGTSSFMSNLSA